jgi:hemerythrin
VPELEKDGRDLEAARKMLASFEDLLLQHIADRDRLRAEFAASPR